MADADEFGIIPPQATSLTSLFTELLEWLQLVVQGPISRLLAKYVTALRSQDPGAPLYSYRRIIPGEV